MATLEELENGLRKAHAAGNADHARRFADAIRQMRGSQPKQRITAEQARDPSLIPEERYRAAGIDPAEAFSTPESRARAEFDASSWIDRPLIGAGAEFKRIGRGVGQLFTADDSTYGRELQAAVDADAPLQDGIHGVSGFVGRALPYLATLPLGGPEAAALSRVPQAGRLGQAAVKAGTAAAEGAAYGGLGEVRSGDSRLENAGLGALGGVVGRGLVGGGRTVAESFTRAADPVLRESIELAQRAGIPLHLSQVAQTTPAKYAASLAKYLPFSGSGAAARKQQDAWNEALTKAAGDKTKRLDDSWVAGQRKRFNSEYDQIWSRNDVVVRPQTAAAMQKIVADAYRDLGNDGGRVVENQFNRILDDVMRAGEGGKISGRNYQALSSALAGVQPGTQVGQFVGRLRSALIADADASVSKGDMAKLRNLNSEYNNFKTLDELLKRAAGANADISPAALWGAVNKRGPKATQEFRDLAKVGQTLLKDPIPQNGLIGSGISSLVTGGTGVAVGSGAVLPALAGLAAASLGGRALNSSTLGALAARGAGKPNGLARLLEAGGAAGATRRGVGKSFQKSIVPNSYDEDIPLEIDIIGGNVGAAPSQAEMDALRARMRRGY